MSVSRLLFALSAAAMAGAWTPAARAQDAPLAEDNGEADEPIVVSASRSGEGIPVDQLGASVTVLDAAALDQRQTRMVSDILRDVPGVAVSRTGAIGGFTQVRLRGSESNHVLVLIDGIEAADPYQGEYDFGSLIADPSARIEVLRGQQSSLYGSDAIGGVIHYITPSGAEAPGFNLRAEGGSFDTLDMGTRVAGVSGDLDYAISGAYHHTGGYPTARNGVRDVGSDVLGASTRLTWQPSEHFKLTGVGRYSYTRAEANESEDDAASPLFGHAVDSPGVSFDNQAFYGLLSAEVLALDGRWSNSLSGQIADFTRRGYAPPVPGAPSVIESGNKGQRMKGSFVSSLRLGSDRFSHRLTAAVDAERESFRNTAPGSGSPFDAFTGERHTDNLGFVVQYELLAMEALSLGASIRHDDNDRFDDATTYRVQGSYALPTGTRIRGAWGTGVKNPGYYELFGFFDGEYIGNPNLQPERSEGWEVGLEQSFGGGAATLGLTYFGSRLEDEIFTTFPPPDFVATPANLATLSKQHGVEAFLAARLGRQFRVDAAYTYLNADENGVAEVRRPKHVGSFNATFIGADERFSGTVTVRYNGKAIDVAFIDPVFFIPTRVTLDDFVLVNLGAEFKLRPNVSITGRVENLLDQDYEEVFSFATPGLAAYAGAQVRF